MSSQYGELRLTSGWDRFGCLRHPSKFQRVSRLGFVTARHSSSGCQPNFAALNRWRQLYSAGRPSRWALGHILVVSVIAVFLENSENDSKLKDWFNFGIYWKIYFRIPGLGLGLLASLLALTPLALLTSLTGRDWRVYLSGTRCKWFPADATATSSSLAPAKSRMVYLYGAGLPRLSWKKPLNWSSSNSSNKTTLAVYVPFAAKDAWYVYIICRSFKNMNGL